MEHVAAYAKANPGKLSMANLGKVGSMELVVMHQLQDALGIKVKQIAFDKPAERYGALIVVRLMCCLNSQAMCGLSLMQGL